MPGYDPEDGAAEPKLDPALLKLIHALADMQARADHKREMEEAMSFKEVDRFKCRGASGREYTVVERRRVIASHQMAGTAATLGTLDFITTTGEDVSDLDDGTFKIVRTDEILRRI